MPADEAMVERGKSGDRGAFEKLFLKYRDMVFNVAWSISGDRELAEDIAQETFVKAYLGLRGFRGRSKFSTWLYRIAVNEALHAKTTRKRRAEVEQPLDDLVPASDQPAPGEAAELSAMEKSVRRAIAELPTVQRAVVTLRYLEGLALAEVAEILGRPIGTVKSQIHYALKTMSYTLRDWRNDV